MAVVVANNTKPITTKQISREGNVSLHVRCTANKIFQNARLIVNDISETKENRLEQGDLSRNEGKRSVVNRSDAMKVNEESK